jgi:hypothetical protein
MLRTRSPSAARSAARDVAEKRKGSHYHKGHNRQHRGATGPQGRDPEAWRYVTYLTLGSLVSRGLAKAGSRESLRDLSRPAGAPRASTDGSGSENLGLRTSSEDHTFSKRPEGTPFERG